MGFGHVMCSFTVRNDSTTRSDQNKFISVTLIDVRVHSIHSVLLAIFHPLMWGQTAAWG